MRRSGMTGRHWLAGDYSKGLHPKIRDNAVAMKMTVPSSRLAALILGLHWSYKLRLRFSRSRLSKIVGNSCLNSAEVTSPARNALQRCLILSCASVRALKVLPLLLAESVFPHLDTKISTLLLSFLICVYFLWGFPVIMLRFLCPKFIQVPLWNLLNCSLLHFITGKGHVN
jgi:hypothetical protein